MDIPSLSFFQSRSAVSNRIPQILYNVPGRTACDMVPATAGRLSRICNIIGIKETTAELDRVASLREQCGDGIHPRKVG